MVMLKSILSSILGSVANFAYRIWEKYENDKIIKDTVYSKMSIMSEKRAKKAAEYELQAMDDPTHFIPRTVRKRVRTRIDHAKSKRKKRM